MRMQYKILIANTPKSSNKKTINKTEKRRQSKHSNSPRLEVLQLSLAKDKDLD